MAASLQLIDHATRDDLRVYLERVSRTALPEVRLVTRGTTLAVFGCTQAPESLIDSLPTVLVLRSFELSRANDAEVDVVVTARSLLDRIARMGLLGLSLELPEVTVTAAWAGVLPPPAGWQARGLIDISSLVAVAAEGVRRVAEALPDQPGEAVVKQVRAQVWGAEIAPGLPASAAFAAEALGFLAAAADAGSAARLSATATWRRLTTDHGDVLVRGSGQLMG